MPETVPPHTGRPLQQARPRAPLAVAMLGFFVVALDAQIVNVALPHIRTELGGGLSGLQWIVTSYTLMFSALQLFGGSMSDRTGARRAYGIGMTVFVLGSAACGAAPALPVLIGGRVVQGIGAAMITPTSLALIREAYHDAVQRGRAITYWALGGSVAAAAGPVLGGVLTQFGWRWIFLVNLPVGVLALVVLSRVAPSARRVAPFDWAGQIAAIAALGGLTFGIIEGGSAGYAAREVLAAFALAASGATVFLVAQARGRHPMMPLDLFRSTTVSTGLGIAFITMAAFYGVVFVQSLWFQEQRGATALATGLLFLPMTGLVALLNPFVGRAMERLGKIVTTIGGMVLLAAGLIALAVLPADAPVPVAALLMIPVGLGGSFTVPPLTALIMDHVPAERAGTASGVLNTARQMGGSLGIAVFGAVLTVQPSFQAGLRIDYAVTGAVLVVLAALAIRLRGQHEDAEGRQMTDLNRRGALGAAGLAGLAALTGCATQEEPAGRTSTPPMPEGTHDVTPSAQPSKGAKALLVYFSRPGENYWEGGRHDLDVGNTKRLAQLIADKIACDVYEITAADPYPEAYDSTVERNVREQDDDARPVIAGQLPDLSGYDTVLLGSPVWNVRAPMIMFTFIAGVDLTGKHVLPFVTYAVSGMAGVDRTYRAALSGSDVRDGLAVRGEEVDGPRAAADVEAWLRGNALI